MNTETNRPPDPELASYIDRSTSRITKVLKEYDRLEDNPDQPSIEQVLTEQLTQSGTLSLTIFACPSPNASALTSNNPTLYAPNMVKSPDLFTPRVSKLNSLAKQLAQNGIRTEINVIVGDTDFTDYILPELPAEIASKIELTEYKKRLAQYNQSFLSRAEKLLDTRVTVIPISELGDISGPQADIDPEDIQKEMAFLEWLFSTSGPYQGKISFSPQQLENMARRKIQSYSDQGFLVSDLTGGLLLQTERPWLLRTRMLKSSGANFATIYPWIRSEEDSN